VGCSWNLEGCWQGLEVMAIGVEIWQGVESILISSRSNDLSKSRGIELYNSFLWTGWGKTIESTSTIQLGYMLSSYKVWYTQEE